MKAGRVGVHAKSLDLERAFIGSDLLIARLKRMIGEWTLGTFSRITRTGSMLGGLEAPFTARGAVGKLLRRQVHTRGMAKRTPLLH
jgi:hypothetical protein